MEGEFINIIPNHKKTKKENVNVPTLKSVIENNCITDFDKLIAPYKQSDFIPINLINNILIHFFPNGNIIHKFTQTHFLLSIPITNLLVAPMTNWEYNRPPDLHRCEDIARYIYNRQLIIDSMLYVSYNNNKKTFEILDGIHRFTSLKIIANENHKPNDLSGLTEFGYNGNASWLYNQQIILNIRFNSTQGDLIELFKTLNKSQVVPDLYIRDTSKEKKQVIETIANEWQIRYKGHFSSSANPNTGNTNRNIFVSLLDILYDKFDITENNINILRGILEEGNKNVSKNIPTQVFKSKIYEKCCESGCFLFIYKNDKFRTC
jgi:hypothetical protein